MSQVNPTCPNCGAPAPAGTKFCSECGAAIPQERKCRSCGAVLAPTAKFCGECGATLPASPLAVSRRTGPGPHHRAGESTCRQASDSAGQALWHLWRRAV